LLSAASLAIGRHDEQSALVAITQAVEYDPGVRFCEQFTDCKRLLEGCIPKVLSEAKSPTTLWGFAAVAHDLGNHVDSKRLFLRYLMLALKEDLYKISSMQ